MREHDDDSAVVRRSAQGIHETFWGCCGQTVDGDGDQGPPTGFCFIGTHTTDREEARYRQDGTPEDDKLGDCAKLRCGTRKPKRKRATSMGGDSDEDAAVDLSTLEPRERHARRKSEGGVTKYAELQSDEDIAMSDEEEKKPKPKAAGKKKAIKDKEEKDETPEPPKSATKTADRKSKKAEEEAAVTDTKPKKSTKKRKMED